MIANALVAIGRLRRSGRARALRGAVAVSVASFAAAGLSEAAPPTPDASPTTSASSAPAAAEDAAPAPSARPPLYGSTDGADTRDGLDPFPSSGRYLAYGVALDTEVLLAAGQICPDFAHEGCVIGGGGGLVFSGAYRVPRASLGLAYSATFHDSNSIYQRGVLMQLRGEYRVRPRALAFGDSIAGYGGVGAGVATYGDNWDPATEAATGHLMAGVEIDLSVKLALVIGFAYRALYFRKFDDASGQHRPTGLVQMLGIEIGLELHDPL